MGAPARVPAARGGGEKPEAQDARSAPARPAPAPAPAAGPPAARLRGCLRPPGSTGGAGGGKCAAAGLGAEGRPRPGAGSLRREHLPGAWEHRRPGAPRASWRPRTSAGPWGRGEVEGEEVPPRSARSLRGRGSSRLALVSAVRRAGVRAGASEWADHPTPD